MSNVHWPAVAWRPAPERGRLRVTGRDRQAFLQNMTTNDVRDLAPGRGQPSVLVNQRAAILDWLGLYAEAEAYLLITGPGRGEADREWLDRYVFSEDVAVEDLTGDTCLFYVTGGEADAAVRAIAPDAGPFALAAGRLDGHAVQVLGTHGLEGPGYYLLAPAGAAVALAAWLESQGKALSDEDAARWRLEAGIPAFGPELNEQHTPWEARLDDSISLHKGCYLGQEVVARLHAYHKVPRYLVGLTLPQVPEPDATLYAGEQAVGTVTSACATADGAIALAYVKASSAEPGTPLAVAHGGERLPATVSDRPFWAHLDRSAGLAPRS